MTQAAARGSVVSSFSSKLPAATPSIITGLRLSFGYSWRALIAAELIAASSGLGYMIMDAELAIKSGRCTPEQSLDKLAKGRTTFTIAHRLTTIRNATLILVLTKDGIAERGSHKELMAKKGIYYHLYKDSADLTEPAEETAE